MHGGGWAPRVTELCQTQDLLEQFGGAVTVAQGRKGKIRAPQFPGPVCMGREGLFVAVPWETMDLRHTKRVCSGHVFPQPLFVCFLSNIHPFIQQHHYVSLHA